MTWFAFIFALEAGFQSQSELMYLEPRFDTLVASYQIDSPYIALEAAGELFDFMQIGGTAKIFMADTNSWQYAPYDVRFIFYTQLHYKGFSLGWEHLCIHPILSGSRPDIDYLYGGGDRLFLRIEAKLNPFS